MDDPCPETIQAVCWREPFLATFASGSAAEALGGHAAADQAK